MKNRKPKFLQLGKSRDCSVTYVKSLMCEGGKKSKDNTALQVQAKVSWILFGIIHALATCIMTSTGWSGCLLWKEIESDILGWGLLSASIKYDMICLTCDVRAGVLLFDSLNNPSGTEG